MAAALVVELIAEARRFREGLNDASNQTQTFGEKMASAGKSMTAFATVPIIGFLGAAAKGAADDAAAADHLAKTLETATSASQKQVAAVEEYIGAAMKASTFTDDELRPAFESLALSSGSVAKSQKLMQVAMDVAAGKGISLETAALAVAKANEGQFAAVNKLVPGLLDLKDKTLTAEQATKKLADTFNGQAKGATETTAGKMKNLNRDMGEMVESIGGAVLPILTKLVDAFKPVLDWFSNLSEGTQKWIVYIGLAIAAIGPIIALFGVFTAAVGALSTAFWFLAANPVVAIIAAVALLAVGLFALYKNFEPVHKAIDWLWQAIQTGFDWVKKNWPLLLAILTGPIGLAVFAIVKNWDSFKAAGAAAVEWVTDKVKGLVDWLGKIPEKIGSIVSKIPGAGIAKNVVGGIGGLFRASGGPVTGGNGYIVGEKGPEWFVPGSNGNIIPNHRLGGSGGGATVINISVGGSVISEGQLIDAVHSGLLNKQRRTGNLGIEAA